MTDQRTAPRPIPYSHCHLCGTPYGSTAWPRVCPACNDQRWASPTPIGVLLQPVTDGIRTGILTPIRGHAPQAGRPALVGGFSESSDDGACDTAAREDEEEIRIGRKDASKLILMLSRGSGPMEPPGRRQQLTFCRNPEAVHIDIFRDWQPDAETTAIQISWTPRVLAFPTHTEAMAIWFRDQQGMAVPDAYVDQPRTGDGVEDGPEDACFVLDVPYHQPLLDDGVWMVIVEHGGAPTRIRRRHGMWVAQR